MKTVKWKDPKFIEEFVEAVKTSESTAETLRKIGLQPKGSNYKTVKKYIELLSLDNSHWLGQSHLKGKKRPNFPKLPLKEVLVENSHFSTYHLKQRLVKEKLLTYHCYICNIQDWMDNPLALHLDHINGIATDNRLENLRLLCPNCHSQTKTYCGKNNKNNKPAKFCIDCNSQLKGKTSSRCRKCEAVRRLDTCTKIEWPETEQLIEMLKKQPVVTVAKQLGVSDNAIRHRLKNRNLWPKS